MQLRLLTLISLTGFALFGQDSSKINLKNIEVDFLASYYQQDGNHSPVTGGRGTEQLNNIAPSIIINVPISKTKSFNISGGVDVYSSASSDNINNPTLDPNHVSSASAMDARSYGNFGFKSKNLENNNTRSYGLGISNEFDVNSFSLNYGYTFASSNNNRELSLKGKYFFDAWQLIYPSEHRNGIKHLNTNIRQTVSLSTIGSIVLTPKLNASWNTDLVYQTGLLSTPFHRVYFAGSNNSAIEKLPSTRFKIPTGVRLNWTLGYNLIWRNYYRYYWDSWDINAHTYETELVIKAGESWRFYPFYRYHTQTAAKYFGAYQTIEPDAAYYTSDFDLSELSSQKFGLGISYSPLYGLTRWNAWLRKDKAYMLKSLDVRYGHYQRSDGFNANVISVGLKFSIDNGGWGPKNWRFVD